MINWFVWIVFWNKRQRLSSDDEAVFSEQYEQLHSSDGFDDDEVISDERDGGERFLE